MSQGTAKGRGKNRGQKRQSLDAPNQDVAVIKSPYNEEAKPAKPKARSKAKPKARSKAKSKAQTSISTATPSDSQDSKSIVGPSGAAKMIKTVASRQPVTFFQRPCIDLAKHLLGQTLVRVLADGQRLTGRIVETEAYVGAEDTASNTYQGKRTKGNEGMYKSPGHAFVYMTYGMYHCINITSEGEGQAVLLRALAPIEGATTMETLRINAGKNKDRTFKEEALCNGPSKLCMALDIDRNLNTTDLTSPNAPMWVETGDQIADKDIVSCPRIGIHSATKEWVEKPLRFYVKGDPCISKRNKLAEEELASKDE